MPKSERLGVKMRRTLKRSTRKYLIIGGMIFLAIILAFTTVYLVTVRRIRVTYEEKLKEMGDELEENSREVYITTKVIEGGEELSLEHLEMRKIYSNIPNEQFITADDMGKLAKINIGTDAYILKSMITEEKIESGIRESEFRAIQLNSNLIENDSVDVRILFPNGENFTVLSKKSIKNVNLDSHNCFLWLNEEELLNISSAIVDAFLHEGTKLYTVKYIEPSIQSETIVDYQPNEDVLLLIANDPNIVDVAQEDLNIAFRRDLEKRLEVFEKKYGTAVDLNEIGDGESQDGTLFEDEYIEQEPETSEEGEQMSDEYSYYEEEIEYVE